MHLLPQSFEFRRPTPHPKGASVGTAALLLPVAVRFFFESLPHLLPRQAFSVLGFGVLASDWLRIFEKGMAREAASRICPQDVDDLQAIIDRQRESGKAESLFQRICSFTRGSRRFRKPDFQRGQRSDAGLAQNLS